MHIFHEAIDIVVANAFLEKHHVTLLREVDKYCKDTFRGSKIIFDRKTASVEFTAYCYDHPNGFCKAINSPTLHSKKKRKTSTLSDGEIFTYVVLGGDAQLLKRMLKDGVTVPRYVFLNGKRLHACSLALLSSSYPVTKMVTLLQTVVNYKDDCFEIFYFMVKHYVDNVDTCYEQSLRNIQLFIQVCTKTNGGFQFSQDDVYVLAKTLFTADNIDFAFKKKICRWLDGFSLRTMLCMYNQHKLIETIGLDKFTDKEISYTTVSGNLQLYEQTRTRNRRNTRVAPVSVTLNVLVSAILNGCSWDVLQFFLNDWTPFWQWDLSHFCSREVYEILISTAAFSGSLDILTHLPYAVTPQTQIETWDFSNLFFAVKGNQANLFTHIVQNELDMLDLEPVLTEKQVRMSKKVLKSTTQMRNLIFDWRIQGFFANSNAVPEQIILREPLVLCFVFALYFRLENIINVYCENNRCRTVVYEIIQRNYKILQFILTYVTNNDLVEKIAKTFSYNTGQSFVKAFVVSFDGPAYIEALQAMNHELIMKIHLRPETVECKEFTKALMQTCEFIKDICLQFSARRYSSLQQQMNNFPSRCVYQCDYSCGSVLFENYSYTPETFLHRAIICLRLVETKNPYFMKTRSWKTFISALPDIIP